MEGRRGRWSSELSQVLLLENRVRRRLKVHGHCFSRTIVLHCKIVKCGNFFKFALLLCKCVRYCYSAYIKMGVAMYL